MKALSNDWAGQPLNIAKGWTPNKAQLQQLKQQNFQCSICGLRSRPSKKHMSGLLNIVNTEDCNNKAVCVLCFQTQALNLPVNQHKEHGTLFFQPDLSQGQINQLALRAMQSQIDGNQNAQWMLTMIREIERLNGKAAQILMLEQEELTLRRFLDIQYSLPESLKPSESLLLGGIRYWPLLDPYKPFVSFYAKASLEKEREAVTN